MTFLQSIRDGGELKLHHGPATLGLGELGAATFNYMSDSVNWLCQAICHAFQMLAITENLYRKLRVESMDRFRTS